MAAPKFHPLEVLEIRKETADCVSVLFKVPDALKEEFQFTPGQYLTLKKPGSEPEIRRSYSICCAPSEGQLRVAVKKVQDGQFSTYVNEQLRPGDILEVMTPMGKFSPRHPLKAKRYLAIAAGSGITPIMSILKHTLATDPSSTFTLIYGNKNRNTIMFREEVEGLKNLYMQRLRVYHVLSRETMDVPLFNGRITAGKIEEFCNTLVRLDKIDEAFICGPEEMLLSIREKLLELGMPQEKIHIELFTSPDQPKASHAQWVSQHKGDISGVSKVSIRLDGVQFEMNLPYQGDSILDAALKHGADLPYACKGGVCSTCRAKLIDGEVDMEVNYALEPDEIEKGYILTCQSHPKSEKVVVDFDAR
jgi:ring-1,2-phenylacetyl-CoA epoxidase subunit PaaE